MKFKSSKMAVPFCFFCLMGIAGTANAKYPIAGVKPDARPEGAPVIQQAQHDQKWFELAMTGVEKPYGKGLNFIKNQGSWYTPFAVPGMSGPYDIRGWHK